MCSVVSVIYGFATILLLSLQNDDKDTSFPYCLLPQLSIGTNGGKMVKGTREDTAPPRKSSLPQVQELGSKRPMHSLDSVWGSDHAQPSHGHTKSSLMELIGWWQR